jgi:lipoprotein-anchoring transpeptidase ErfK/SrfK
MPNARIRQRPFHTPGILGGLAVALCALFLILPRTAHGMEGGVGVAGRIYRCSETTELADSICPPQRQVIRRQVGEIRWASATPVPPTPPPAPPITPPALDGRALVVDQTAQLLRVYDDGAEIHVIPVSTGMPRYYTPAFVGRVGHYVPTFWGFGAFVDHAWYITRAWGNIYIHGAPYTEVEGEKVYQDLEFLGVKPVSHGCIRVSPDDAHWLLEWGPVGVPIRVTPPDFTQTMD